METRYTQSGIGRQREEESAEQTREGRSRAAPPSPSSPTHQHRPPTLDMTSVLKASQAIAGEIVLDTLLEKLMRIVLENAGAQRGFLILEKAGQWVIEAIGAVNRAEVAVLPAIPLETHGHAYLSATIVQHVALTHTSVVLTDASHDGPFTEDRYIQDHHTRSILCLPLIHQGNLRGMLYLENNEITGAFTEAGLEVLNLLSGQIVTSIEHAYLYERMEEMVEQRTLELSQTNRALQDEVTERKRAEEMLRKARDELEQRVQERTAELSRANISLHAEIAERRLAEQQLRHRTLHDTLTNLPNRTLFAEILGHAMKYAKRHRGYAFAVVFLDLDNFKVVNDSLGHLAGDQLLVTTAGRLKACLRTSDTVARFGGDEFVILLEDVDSINEVTDLTNRIQQELAVPLVIDEHEVITSASVGIVLGSSAYVHPSDVLRDADTAMYRAKSLGPGNYAIFDTAMHAHMLQRLHTESALRRAIEHDELSVYYQPIVDLATGVVAGFEALVRWHHPQRGLISPDEFIATAEEAGLIIPLDLWVAREACRQTCAWRSQFPDLRPLTINVNLSNRAFVSLPIVDQIAQILCETGLDAANLKLEITENVMMDHTEKTMMTLTRLRQMGVQLCIDDFGTGYSSLRYLHRFPIQTLKIDKSFTFSLHTDTESMVITQGIVTLSHMLGKQVVAEGIETPEQLAHLRGLNCEYGQGYLFSPPMEGPKAEALLAARVNFLNGQGREAGREAGRGEEG